MTVRVAHNPIYPLHISYFLFPPSYFFIYFFYFVISFLISHFFSYLVFLAKLWQSQLPTILHPLHIPYFLFSLLFLNFFFSFNLFVFYSKNFVMEKHGYFESRDTWFWSFHCVGALMVTSVRDPHGQPNMLKVIRKLSVNLGLVMCT